MKIGKRVGVVQMDPDYLLPEAIEIGDNSTIGWRTIIATHEFTATGQRYGKVKIGKNVMIGARCTIRGGISIGDNSIICAGSVVTKSIGPNEVWAGVPAKKLGRAPKN